MEPQGVVLASIFLKTNVRETKARAYTGKVLVYGVKEALADSPGQYPSLREEYILRLHSWVYDSPLLDDAQRKLIKPKWMNRLIRELAPLKVEPGVVKELKRDGIFKRYRDLLGSRELSLSKREIKEVEAREAEEAVQDKHLLTNFIPAFTRDRVTTEIRPMFPNFKDEDPHLIRGKMLDALLKELLDTGTLMADSRMKEPKKVWKDYLDQLSDEDKPKATTRMQQVQVAMKYGKAFEGYMTTKGLNRIEEIGNDDIRTYLREMIETNASESHVKKTRAYVASLFQWARDKDLITKDPVGKIKLKGLKKAKGDRQKPFMPGELIYLLRKAKERYEEKVVIYEREERRLDKEKHGRRPVKDENGKVVRRVGEPTGKILTWEVPVKEEWKRERKVDWYALVWLACTGLRPSEVRTCIPKEKTIGVKILEDGKTDAATRDIPRCPTLDYILKDKEINFLAEVKKTHNLAERLAQFVERATDGEIDLLPYKFRHNWGSYQQAMGILTPQEIAMYLGHKSPEFSFKTYSMIEVLFKNAQWNRKQLVSFWSYLSQDYFKVKKGKKEVTEEDFR